MALVARPPAAVDARPAATSNETDTASKSRKHKVVLESVTQEKKKLRQLITFNAKPPVGYTFIPAGNPELTNALKEASRKANAQVYTVTTTPHANVHDLSQQVHRIGYHFSSLIVAEVCHQYGIQLSASGHVIGSAYETYLKGYKGKGVPGAEEDAWDQVTLNTKARDAIKDLFPNIPDQDLYQIIKTAFQKGRKRVGTASELPLARRAQLAVVAHIRHCYTAYDRLLRNGGYHDARGVVEKPTLAKLIEWRGDDENGAKVLEDVFREVVVISDDEDSDDDDYDPEAPLKELSVEVMPRRINTGSHPTKSIGHHRVSGYVEPVTVSDDESPPGVHLVSHKTKRPDDEYRNARRGQAYNQIWNAVREEYRAGPRQQPAPGVPYPTHQTSTLPRHGGQVSNGVSSFFQKDDFLRSEQQAPPPRTIVGADGTVYTRVDSSPRLPHSVTARTNAQASGPYDPSRPLLPEHLQRQAQPFPVRSLPLPPATLDNLARESEIVLPSVEKEDVILPKQQHPHIGSRTELRVTPPNYHRLHDAIDLTDSIERPQAKKRRYEETFEPDYNTRAPAPRLMHQETGPYQNRVLTQVERVEPYGSPHSRPQRGRDRINGDHFIPPSQHGPGPKVWNPPESEHISYGLFRPRVPEESHEPLHLRAQRSEVYERPTDPIPLNVHRPQGIDPLPRPMIAQEPIRTSGAQESAYGTSRQALPSFQDRDVFRRGEPPRIVQLNQVDDVQERLRTQRPYVSGDVPSVHSHHTQDNFSRYDRGAPTRPLDGRGIYRRIEPPRDPLPRQMEQLSVGQPSSSARHYEDVRRRTEGHPNPITLTQPWPPAGGPVVPPGDVPPLPQLFNVDSHSGGYATHQRPVYPDHRR